MPAFGDWKAVSSRIHQRLVRDKTLDDACGGVANASGVSAITAEYKLDQIGLRIFIAYGARMGAQQPALQVQDRLAGARKMDFTVGRL